MREKVTGNGDLLELVSAGVLAFAGAGVRRWGPSGRGQEAAARTG
jgi:hypothetical protein